MNKKRRLAIVSGVLALVFAGGIAAVVFSFASIEPFEIEGPSMEPGWIDGDRVVVDRLVTEPRPGDVVILESPDDDITIMKRVIGVGGDEIDIDGFFVMRNGEPITADRVDAADDFICFQEEIEGRRFRTKRDPLSPTFDPEPVVVPADHIYVLGDHRARSNDSRFFGPVPVERIVGIVGDHYFRATPRDPCEDAP